MFFKLVLSFTLKRKVPYILSFGFFTFMTIWCQKKCIQKCPGVVTSDDSDEITIQKKKEMEESVPFCKKCNVYKIKRSHHCSTCNKCIMKMDHHCTWINNCVGLYNQKHFILYNFYSMLMCINCGIVVFYKILMCVPREIKTKISGCIWSPFDIFNIILSSLCSLTFGLFVFVMLIDQYWAIKTNTTGVEHFKREKGEVRSFYETLLEVFGEPFSYRWLLPIDAKVKET